MKNVRHIGIVVKDLDEVLKFYRDLLGLKIKGRTDESGEFISKLLNIKNVKLRTVKLAPDDNKTRVELIEFLDPRILPKKFAQLNNNGLTHIAITVSNLDDTYNKLKMAGVTFTTAPIISPDKQVKATVCQDPEGNFLELIQEL